MQTDPQPKEVKMYVWLREQAGTSIDALEQALNGFSTKDPASVMLLRRHAHHVLVKAREFGMPAITNIAQATVDSTPQAMRGGGEALLRVLREVVRASRKRVLQPGDSDSETGLINGPAFARLLEKFTGESHTPAAVGAIGVADAEALCRQYGDAITGPLARHIARILDDQFRDDDQIARMGDLEFAVLLPMEDMDGFGIAMKRVAAAVERETFTFPDGQARAVGITFEGRLVGSQFRPEKQDWQKSKSQTLIGTVSNIAAQAPSGPPRYVGISISNEITATVLTSLLERAGYRVIIPDGTGNNRLATFAVSKVHLIIADDPHTTLPLLRAALGRRRTAVIMICENDATGEWALEHGAREYVTKPVHMEVLLAAIKRHARRGRLDTEAVPGSAGGIVVASDEMGQLIALGSALQKRGGFFVRFGHGAEDAIKQIEANAPAAVVIDMSLRREETHKVLKCAAGMKAPPAVILIVSEAEMIFVPRIADPKPAGVLKKPVDLKTFHLEIQRMAHHSFASDAAGSQEILRAEILRTMRTINILAPKV